MTQVVTRLPTDVDLDPRWVRSRTRLLDAAAELLAAGGIEAVTIDAVTKQSRVARTTLYRHFGCSSDLLAATLERLLPPVVPPPSTGSLRDQLIELVWRQATLYGEAPLHLTTLAWLALRSNSEDPNDAPGCPTPAGVLQARVVEHYMHPIATILHSPQAREELGEIDIEFAACQLSGPLLFGWMAGLRVADRIDCARIVDDFLYGHQRAGSSTAQNHLS